jgi:hypothetical protein
MRSPYALSVGEMEKSFFFTWFPETKSPVSQDLPISLDKFSVDHCDNVISDIKRRVKESLVSCPSVFAPIVAASPSTTIVNDEFAGFSHD